MPRILVTPYLLNGMPGSYRDTLERAGFEVVYPTVDEPDLHTAALVAHLDGVSGVLAGSEPYTARRAGKEQGARDRSRGRWIRCHRYGRRD